MSGLLYKVYYTKPSLIPYTTLGVYPNKVNLNTQLSILNGSGAVTSITPILPDSAINLIAGDLVFGYGLSVDTAIMSTTVQSGNITFGYKTSISVPGLTVTQSSGIGAYMFNSTLDVSATLLRPVLVSGTASSVSSNITVGPVLATPSSSGVAASVLYNTLMANANLVIKAQTGTVGAILTQGLTTNLSNLYVVLQSGHLNFLFLPNITTDNVTVNSLSSVILINGSNPAPPQSFSVGSDSGTAIYTLHVSIVPIADPVSVTESGAAVRLSAVSGVGTTDSTSVPESGAAVRSSAVSGVGTTDTTSVNESGAAVRSSVVSGVGTTDTTSVTESAFAKLPVNNVPILELPTLVTESSLAVHATQAQTKIVDVGTLSNDTAVPRVLTQSPSVAPVLQLGTLIDITNTAPPVV